MPPLRALDELARGDRIAGSVEHVLPQEHLMRRMRRIGLVLVDVGGRGVDRTDIVGVRRPDDRRIVTRTPSLRDAWRGSGP